MTFRWKLFASYVLLAVVMAMAFYFQASRLLEGRIIDESRQFLLNESRLAMMTYEHLFKSWPAQQIAEQLGSGTRSRVTLIARDGRVIADSDVKPDQIASLENHRNRPEVQQALASGSGSAVRYSDTLRVNMLYVAISGNNGDGTVLRLALPLKSLDSAKKSLNAMLAGAFAALLVLAMALSAILSNLTSRPLRAMAEAAARFGAGEHGVRMPVHGKDEIGYLGQVLNQMAGRLEEQMSRLASERQRLDAILHGMGEGVMVLDTAGTITLINPALRGQLAIAGAVEGKGLVEVCRHPDLLQAYQEHRENGGEVFGEVALPDGKTYLSTHWVPLGDRQGTVAVFHDISELKRIETIRKDFVANVSHELRTPVAVIKGYAETLLDGALEESGERSRNFVAVIAEHAERLTNLINDVLALSRLEGKEAVLDLKPVDLSGTIQKSAKLLEEHARSKGIGLEMDLPAQLPEVMADQAQMEQVLLNLLDNAIKYTRSGGRISLTAVESAENIIISVSDTGVGIPEKDIARIFERFYRVDEGRSREQGGTGLGLAIVKHIVQQHGGQISVESELGKGSCFTLSIRKI